MTMGRLLFLMTSKAVVLILRKCGLVRLGWLLCDIIVMTSLASLVVVISVVLFLASVLNRLIGRLEMLGLLVEQRIVLITCLVSKVTLNMAPWLVVLVGARRLKSSAVKLWVPRLLVIV